MNDEGQRPESLGGQSEARYERERDEQTRLRSLGALSHMLPVMSFIYAAAAVLFLIAPPFTPNTPHVFICATASAFGILVWAGMRVDDPRFDTPISVATISIAAGMGLTMFAVSGAISNTTTLAISIVAAGALLYRLSMFAVMVGVVFLGWTQLAYGYPSGPYILGMFHLWAATVVGALVLHPTPPEERTCNAGGAREERATRLALELIDRDRRPLLDLLPQLPRPFLSSIRHLRHFRLRWLIRRLLIVAHRATSAAASTGDSSSTSADVSTSSPDAGSDGGRPSSSSVMVPGYSTS